MILTDREIRVAIHEEQIIINPAPRPECYSSTAVDLTLANFARRWTEKALAGVKVTLSPGAQGFSYARVKDEFQEPIALEDGGFVLRRGEFILAWTHETLHLPTRSRIAARVEGKSSLARMGITAHVTAPTIHAGFQGQIQLEIVNHSPLTICLTPGMRICQLIFEQTFGTAEQGYAGQFAGQRAAATR